MSAILAINKLHIMLLTGLYLQLKIDTMLFMNYYKRSYGVY